MKKRDIWWAPIPEGKRHPVVILSPTAACEDSKFPMINVLVGVTKRPGMPEESFHVVLNGGDGLADKTLLDCYLVQAIEKKKLTGKIGIVSQYRRKKILELVRAIVGSAS